MKVTATPVDEFTLEIKATSVEILLLLGATRPGRRSKAELKRLEEFGTSLAMAAGLVPLAPAPKKERKTPEQRAAAKAQRIAENMAIEEEFNKVRRPSLPGDPNGDGPSRRENAGH